MVLEPCLRSGRDPPNGFHNSLMVLDEVPRKDWLVVGDAVSQPSQMVQRAMDLLASQSDAMGEGTSQGGAPERHLVVWGLISIT